MKKGIRFLTLGILFTLLLVSFNACTKENKTVNVENSEKVEEAVSKRLQEDLIIRLEGSDTGLPNPFRHTSRGPGMSKMQILYDSLLEKDEEGNIPWLAKKWTVSEDGMVYTFYLQENILWHDGTPLTAEDVAFTFNYYRDHSPVVNDLIVNGTYIVEEANVLDEKTVELKLNSYDNTYITKIGFMRIIPKHIWENVTDPKAYDGIDAAIGSGPYQLEKYSAEEGTYRYIAFEKYWGLKPSTVAIEWLPVGDRVMAFENGNIDLINASADILNRYEADSRYTVKKVDSYHSYRLMMNMEKIDILKDGNVRKALAYGINREELVNKVARGSGKVSSMAYVPKESPWYNDAIMQYSYNEEEARKLLGEKAYSFKLLIGNSAEEVKIAELIELDLAKIGITLTIESVEAKVRDNAIKTGEYELLLVNSGGMGGDPDYLRTVYSPNSSGQSTIQGYSNERLNQLAKAQGLERDENKRKEMIFEMQEIIAEDVPMVMLYGAVDNFVYVTEKYDGWMFRYDHNKTDHNKLSYLIRE